MRRAIHLFILIATASTCGYAQAKKIILFLGDAGGIPTLNAASWYKYGHPQKLFIQSMPHLALMDTSAADDLVTDSAAGMSAIVTGVKTNNGVISESADAFPGKQEGRPLETVLEYAEQHGLATGVLSNMDMTDATPAACYAHVNDRKLSGKIFAQVFSPRFGNGIDLIIGGGRDSILDAAGKIGLNAESAMREKGYAFHGSLQEIRDEDRRVIVLMNTEFPVETAVDKAIQILSRNPKGFFLMVEWDMHTDQLRPGLEHVIEMDNAIRRTAERADKRTLIIFTADHSFGLRLVRGKVGEALLPEGASGNGSAGAKKTNIVIDDTHTGEEVLVSAMGPGAKLIHGFFANTDLFHIMMAAYGWEKLPQKH